MLDEIIGFPHIFVFLEFSLFSVFVSPLRSVAGLIVAGEGAQLELIALSGGFKAAPRSQRWIVTHP